MCGQDGVTGWDGWGLQCLFLEGMGMGGTLCTHITIINKRGKSVHNTDGKKLGMGREGWTNIILFGFCRSFGQGRLTRQVNYCGDMGSETCTQYNSWVKGGRFGTWHPRCTSFSSDESLDNISYRWIWVLVGGRGLAWLWFLGRWGIWGGTKCTRANVRIWRGVRFQTIARKDFYIWKGMEFFDTRIYMHNSSYFHRSIEHSWVNRRHILAKTTHAKSTKWEVQRETWMLDTLSTDVKYDMDESPSTTKIKLLMSMAGDHTRRTRNRKAAYRPWIGEKRTSATGIGILLGRAVARAKTDHKDNDGKKSMCKHHLDRKQEGSSGFPVSGPSHRIFFSLVSMPRKKDPPPSALPTRRSTQGVSKPASNAEGEDAEALVGLEVSQEGSCSSNPPPLSVLDPDFCNMNKEVSAVPSVTVSLDASEHHMNMGNQSGSGKWSTGDGGTLGITGVAETTGLARKTGLAGDENFVGLSESDSSGSPGVQSMKDLGSLESLAELGSAGKTLATPPVTPLFSSEFKAMILVRTSVFKPREHSGGEIKSGHGLWGGMASSQEFSDGFGATNMQGDEDLSRPHIDSEGLVTDSHELHVSSDVQAHVEEEDLGNHMHDILGHVHNNEGKEQGSSLDGHVQSDRGGACANSFMGKHGGGKKKVVQIQPSRQQPQRSTQIGATGSPKDSSRGWNPFAHPIPPPVPVIQGCTMNNLLLQSRRVQSSPMNPLVWADVVKGLQSGLKSGSNSGLKQVSTSLKSHVFMLAGVLPSPVALPESDGDDLVVDVPASAMPELVPVVSLAVTSAPKEVHEAVTADVTEACMVNPNGLSAVGPDVHGADRPTDAGFNSVGPEIMQGSGGLHSGGLNTTGGPNDAGLIDTDLDLNSGPVLDGSDGLDSSKIGPDIAWISSSGPETAGLRPCGPGINENNFGNLDSRPAISTPSDPDVNSVGPVNTNQAKVGPGVMSSGSSPTGLILGPKSGLHTSSFGPTTTAHHISARSLQFGSISPTIVHDDLLFACDKNLLFLRRLLFLRGRVWWFLNTPPPRDDDGFVPVQSKKWRVKKPNTGVLNGMSYVAVDPVSIGPAVVGPKDAGLVDVPHVRQTTHYYIEYGFKPPDFVFEKWSPKLKTYYSQLTKVDSTDPGGPSKVIEDVEDDEVASEADESSRFMTMA
ncbi:hypothetical protein L1987_73056 [Smallanthus sonchifolius]|uniref:Uncharacterized protein n=1 Tax=Smallanthus sonchifolius TaxID=185202 RepID=A0ACB8ZYX0_9ASTR|nr:hypothetical protein L1987_73056 [Smallanthus sonchifolius]